MEVPYFCRNQVSTLPTSKVLEQPSGPPISKQQERERRARPLQRPSCYSGRTRRFFGRRRRHRTPNSRRRTTRRGSRGRVKETLVTDTLFWADSQQQKLPTPPETPVNTGLPGLRGISNPTVAGSSPAAPTMLLSSNSGRV